MIHGFLHGVHAIVQRQGQPMDVFPIDGRDEAAVKAHQHFVGELVGVVLQTLEFERVGLEKRGIQGNFP